MPRNRDEQLEHALSRQHLWMPYTQAKTAAEPLHVVASEGVYLQLQDGRRLIDGISSWWTACHGHRHPAIIAALTDQLRQLPHVMMGGIVHTPALELSARLAERLPGPLNHVFFCDSGSVSVEVAMKMAVQFWINHGQRHRNRFVTFRGGYHGDTSGAMSLCDPEEGMHSHFKGFLLEQFPRDLPTSANALGELRSFLSATAANCAAIVIEPLVQAAGGMRMHSPELLAEIHRLARSFDLLVIHDEIATGFGRTGKLFASEWLESLPDMICLGKGLTGGVISLAATVASSEVFAAFYGDDPDLALMHGPTFMGNPLACRAALASLDLFEREPRLRQVAAIEALGREWLSQACQLPGVVEVRARGAFLAIELDHWVNVRAASAAAVEMGVWIRPLRNVVYLAPPITVQQGEMRQLCDAAVELVRRGF